MNAQASLLAIDRDVLLPVVRRVLRDTTVEIVDWTIDKLDHFVVIDSTGGLFRIKGTGRTGGESMPWSLVLKVVRQPADEGVPGDPFYWKREWLAYESGLLAALPGRLVAPRFYGVTERPGGGGWLWMEEVVEAAPRRWPLETYGAAARDLASFNGAYLVDRQLPSYPWLTDGLLRRVVGPGSWLQTRIDPTRPGSFWENALVQHMVPPALADAVLRVWCEADRFVDMLDRLPQVLCHFDAFRRNLMLRRGVDGQAQTVALDWAFIGPGAAGSDLGDLVMQSAFYFEVDPADIARLEEIAYASYLAGLREADWHGDDRLIRLGYTGYIAMRYALCLLAWPSMLLEGEPGGRTVAHFGRPAEEIMAGWITLCEFALERVDEARVLMAAE